MIRGRRSAGVEEHKPMACCMRKSLRTLFGLLCLIGGLLFSVRGTAAEKEFPPELTEFVPAAVNPVFEGRGPGYWDARIRERGWILREGDAWHLWYTGYDGPQKTMMKLGYATSSDGIAWKRFSDQPIYDQHWVEDMMVVKQGDTYYMFAEGLHDHAQLLTSTDRVHWTRVGTLDIRRKDGSPLSPGPFGTPVGWYENDTWHLFYERRDEGVWLATSKDMRIWTNVQDEPVMQPGPDAYDRDLIAFNQVVKHKGRYFVIYHGAARTDKPSVWTTNIAVSDDLRHWKKYAGNPLLRENKSSGILVNGGTPEKPELWLYTMHDRVQLHYPATHRHAGIPIKQAGDGTITCHARDATIHGVRVQYEPQPEKNTIGFWTNVDDWVSWDFTVTMPGAFHVEILQGCGKDQGGSTVELTLAAQTLRFTVEDTGHFQNFIPRTIGTVRLDAAGEYRLAVKPVTKARTAVMDLRQVRLIPVETKP